MTRRAALLLEVLLSLAIFVAAALAVGGAMRRAGAGLERVRERAQASDLAWSAIARLEAGLATPSSLNGEVKETGKHAVGTPGWSLHIETEPTERTGLTLVEVSALRTTPDGTELDTPVYTARQVVRLSRTPMVDTTTTTGIGTPDGDSPFTPAEGSL